MTIKMRILLPMIIFTIVGSVAVLISNIVQFSDYVSKNMNDRLDAALSTTLTQIEMLKSHAYTFSSYLAEDSTIIEAIKSGNRETLLDRAAQLSAETGIEFCSIADAKGIALAHTHEPEKYGDNMLSQAIVRTALSGKSLATVEEGAVIRLAICSSSPIYDEHGDLLGMVVAGFRLDTNKFVDLLKDLFGCEATILLGDKRISTTVVMEDGTRALGTKASANISEVVLAGNAFSGRAKILDHDAYTRYNPITGVDGKVLGMLLVGSYLTEETDTIWSFVQIGLLITLILMAISIPVILFIVRRIIAPINEASGVLREIAQGNFDARVTGDYTGDLALIKSSVNDTAAKLSLYLSEKMQAEHMAHQSELAKARAEAASEAVFASINYASKIQKNLLPTDENFKIAFLDYSVLWRPKDIVGGDLYRVKNFSEGSILWVCDCTGHGTPGALLTMLVSSALESIINVNNYKDTAATIWKLDKNLTGFLYANTSAQTKSGHSISDINDGCDLAVLYAAKDGSVTVSAANIHVFICDGSEVKRIKGQNLRIGEGKLKSKEDVQTVTIPANHNNKFYIASDGLYDQIGGSSELPFGYERLKRIILENHDETQLIISERIWDAFECHRGEQMRRDDVELITFKPQIHMEGY